MEKRMERSSAQKVMRQIEDDAHDPRIIETVWGAGYRLNAKEKQEAVLTLKENVTYCEKVDK